MGVLKKRVSSTLSREYSRNEEQVLYHGSTHTTSNKYFITGVLKKRVTSTLSWEYSSNKEQLLYHGSTQETSNKYFILGEKHAMSNKYFVERGRSAVECRTRNQVSPGSNSPLLSFRRLGIFVLSIDAPVDSAV